MREAPSPNFDSRDGAPIDTLILHYTELESAEISIARLTDPAARVSSHYLVDEDGAVILLVDEEMRAWHAGVSFWAGSDNLNARSIGIEIQNRGHPAGLPPYPDAQIASVIALCQDIQGRHDIPPTRVLAHSDVAPARKIDPGEHFPWARLAAAGVGLWPGDQSAGDAPHLGPGDNGPAVEALKAGLAAFGYGLAANPYYDAETECVVTAFQRHFRPERVNGAADAETSARLTRLLELAGL